MQAEKLSDHRLVFENDLQRSLRDLRLVGGIRRVEFAARKQEIHRGRDGMRMDAGAEKGLRTAGRISPGELMEMLDERRLVQARREVQLATELDLGRNQLRKQLVDR